MHIDRYIINRLSGIYDDLFFFRPLILNIGALVRPSFIDRSLQIQI